MNRERSLPERFRSAPVVAGGLGGSGTRLVARVLETLGARSSRRAG